MSQNLIAWFLSSLILIYSFSFLFFQHQRVPLSSKQEVLFVKLVWPDQQLVHQRIWRIRINQVDERRVRSSKNHKGLPDVVLCDRKMSTWSKAMNSSRGFSRHRHFVRIAEILFGKNSPLCSFASIFSTFLSRGFGKQGFQCQSKLYLSIN